VGFRNGAAEPEAKTAYFSKTSKDFKSLEGFS
jgi:hypothetical protein